MSSPSFLGPKMLTLSGTVIVTGGTSDLSRAFGLALAQAGTNVGIIYREGDNATNLAKEIQENFPNVKAQAYVCDECQLDKLSETFKRIDQELGEVRGVISNADDTVIKPAMELSHDDFQGVYGANVYGVFNTCRAAAKLWEDERREGSIVVTASMSAQIVNQKAQNTPLTQAFYNSSQAAARNLVRALAAEWTRKGIRVNSVSPGYVNTRKNRNVDKNILRHQEKNIPLGRFAEPREVVGQALFLLSPLASYTTGSDHLVDGGQLIW